MKIIEIVDYDQLSEPYREFDLDFVQALRGSIAWIGGAIAGLTALCYGAGYFSLQAYLNMLGLYGVVEIRPEAMLTEGSRFWLVLVSMLLRYAAYCAILVILGVAVFSMLRRSKWLSATGRAIVAFGGRLDTAIEIGVPQYRSLLALLALFAALIYHWDTWFDAIGSLSKMDDLLFAPAAAVQVACDALPGLDPTKDGEVAAQLIVQANNCTPDPLRGEFDYIARGYFVLLPLCILAFSGLDRFISSWATLICRITAGAYFAIFTLSLPGAYGVLMHEPLYPPVSAFGADIKLEGLRLVQDTNGLLVWSATERRLQWLPLRLIDRMEAGQPVNIFRHQKEQVDAQ